jgi:NTP pyrophosphatase (non-canonical NTP hydrolase)
MDEDKRKEAIRHYAELIKGDNAWRYMDLQDVIQAYQAFHSLVENTPRYRLEMETGQPCLPPKHNRSFWRQLHGAMGLAGEGAEVLELYKKRLFGKEQALDRDKVKKELGDILFYLFLSLDANDFSLREVLEANILKLAERYGT